MRIKNILLLSFIALVSITIVTLGTIEISARKGISLVIKSLNRCTSLNVNNSLMMPNKNKTVSVNFENVHINDRGMIEDIAGLLIDSHPKYVQDKGFISTTNWIQIEINDGNIQLCWFRVIGGYVLEVGKKSGPSFYRYNCTNRQLMNKLKEILGLNELNEIKSRVNP